jgi:hypothetical protein
MKYVSDMSRWEQTGMDMGVPQSESIRLMKSQLKKLDDIHQESPFDRYIGNKVHELSSKANEFLFKAGEENSLSLTLNPHGLNRVMNNEPLAENEFVKKNLIDPLPNTKLVQINPGETEDIRKNNGLYSLSGNGWNLSVDSGRGSKNDKHATSFMAAMQKEINSNKIKTIQDIGRAVLKALDYARAESKGTDGNTTFTMSFNFQVKGGQEMVLTAGIGSGQENLVKSDGTFELLTPKMGEDSTALHKSEDQMGINNLFMTVKRLKKEDER